MDRTTVVNHALPRATIRSREMIAIPDMSWTPRRCVAILIVCSAIFRLCWAAGMDLGNDEAYHFLYTVHPDWSYFDHPPMLMWIAQAGRTLCGGWLSTLSLRLGFVLLFAGSTWALFDWVRRWFGDWAGFYAAVAMNAAPYYAAAAGAFILPDGPFLFFALLTLRALCHAMFESTADGITLRVNSDPSGWSALSAWVWVGLACAGAMASKYHGVLLPLSTVAYVIVTPHAWKVLKTPGPYLAAILGAAGLTPVLIWNSQHHWASIAFQGGRAVGAAFHPTGLMMMVFGPIGYLFPWVWFPAVAALVLRLRRYRELKGLDRFLVCQSLLPLTLFFCVSCVRPILPHWPLIAFVPLFPLVGAQWAINAVRVPRLVNLWVRFMAVAVLIVAGLFAGQARYGFIDFPLNSDPAREISGWTSIGRELESRRLLESPDTFLISTHWYESGQLAFSVRNRVPVVCYNEGDARGFAYWSRPEDWVGKNGLLVTVEETPNLDLFRPYFRSIELVDTFKMTRSGKPFRPVQVHLCKDQLRPFPFTYQKSKPANQQEPAQDRVYGLENNGPSAGTR